MKIEVWKVSNLKKDLVGIYPFSYIEKKGYSIKDFDKNNTIKDNNFLYILKSDKEASLDETLMKKINRLRSIHSTKIKRAISLEDYHQNWNDRLLVNFALERYKMGMDDKEVKASLIYNYEIDNKTADRIIKKAKDKDVVRKYARDYGSLIFIDRIEQPGNVMEIYYDPDTDEIVERKYFEEDYENSEEFIEGEYYSEEIYSFEDAVENEYLPEHILNEIEKVRSKEKNHSSGKIKEYKLSEVVSAKSISPKDLPSSIRNEVQEAVYRAERDGEATSIYELIFPNNKIVYEVDADPFLVGSFDESGNRVDVDYDIPFKDFLEKFIWKYSSIKQAFIKHIPGHKNSKGENAPWVIISHKTGKIISSHKTKEEAKKHLQQIEMFKHMKQSSFKKAEKTYEVWVDNEFEEEFDTLDDAKDFAEDLEFENKDSDVTIWETDGLERKIVGNKLKEAGKVQDLINWFKEKVEEAKPNKEKMVEYAKEFLKKVKDTLESVGRYSKAQINEYLKNYGEFAANLVGVPKLVTGKMIVEFDKISSFKFAAVSDWKKQFIWNLLPLIKKDLNKAKKWVKKNYEFVEGKGKDFLDAFKEVMEMIANPPRDELLEGIPIKVASLNMEDLVGKEVEILEDGSIKIAKDQNHFRARIKEPLYYIENGAHRDGNLPSSIEFYEGSLMTKSELKNLLGFIPKDNKYVFEYAPYGVDGVYYIDDKFLKTDSGEEYYIPIEYVERIKFRPGEEVDYHGRTGEIVDEEGGGYIVYFPDTNEEEWIDEDELIEQNY